MAVTQAFLSTAAIILTAATAMVIAADTGIEVDMVIAADTGIEVATVIKADTDTGAVAMGTAPAIEAARLEVDTLAPTEVALAGMLRSEEAVEAIAKIG